VDGVAQRLDFVRAIEITLETNPGTVEHGSFAGYRRAGVNRISFGVQSFDDHALQRIGRIHDAAQAERAIKQAQDADIENLNLDLMYALPQQTIDAALRDVEKAITLQTPHLSHYQLTLEPNTAFAANPPPLPDEDSAWDMQEACQARLAAAGLAQYEVSAYARTGRECTHNLNYWRFGDYLGIGAGAHGKITASSPSAASSPGESSVTGQLSPAGEPAASPHPTLSPAKCRGGEGLHVRRRWKLRSPRGYLEHAGSERRIGGDDPIPDEQLPFEFMLNALRLNRSVALSDFETTTGLRAEAIDRQLAQAQARGWLDLDAGRLRATELGRRFLNDVIASFLPDRETDKSRVHGGPPHA
ncbi:MAG: radical SAM family heme chaperone HemW, partial [Rudaea sp.]